MKKTLYGVVIAVLLVIFAASAFFVGRYILEGKEQQAQFDNLSQIKEQSATKPTETQPNPSAPAGAETDATQPSVPTESGGILPEYADLYAMNNDLVGWIKIEGTKIDYPVMQTPSEADYYLHRDFTKEYSDRGCIYAREVCNLELPSDNITIYGHNMLDGSMFATLHKYQDKSYWEENSLIFFDTLTERHTYKIFAVFKTSANVGEGFSYHQFVDAANEKEFNDFVTTCKDLSKKYYYDTGITPVYGDKLICLSTCEYSLGDNSRLVVAAVRYS